LLNKVIEIIADRRTIQFEFFGFVDYQQNSEIYLSSISVEKINNKSVWTHKFTLIAKKKNTKKKPFVKPFVIENIS